MAIDYIITSALNLSQDQVQSLSTARNSWYLKYLSSTDK